MHTMKLVSTFRKLPAILISLFYVMSSQKNNLLSTNQNPYVIFFQFAHTMRDSKQLYQLLSMQFER